MFDLSAKLILLGRFSGTNHIAQRLMRCIRYPYRCQFSGSIIFSPVSTHPAGPSSRDHRPLPAPMWAPPLRTGLPSWSVAVPIPGVNRLHQAGGKTQGRVRQISTHLLEAYPSRRLLLLRPLRHLYFSQLFRRLHPATCSRYESLCRDARHRELRFLLSRVPMG
jgi:hypothetical protein